MAIYVLLVLLGVVALPFLAEAMRRPVRRGEEPGLIAELPAGATHYRWSGPEGVWA